jgi:hypothetical protein
MKNYLTIAVVALLLSACTQANLDKAALEKSKSDNDSLKNLVTDRDASITDFISSFNEVERNLDSVTARQQLITLSTQQQGDLKPSQRTRINDGIYAINLLMEENRKKLAEMKRKLRNSSNKNVELAKAIATLNNQLAQKDVELIAMNERLFNLNAQVNDLQTALSIITEESMVKSQTIAEETMALHTAYYLVAESKYLKDAKIIDRNGGLLGMGKTSKLSSNIDNNKFTRIDYTQTTTIEVNSNMKLITTHPIDSYVLDADMKNKKRILNLSIVNPEKFWSASKYLVIQKD